MKVALCGVKYIKYVADIERENQRLDSSYNTPFAVKEAGFNLIDGLFGVIGRIKLNNLINLFPIDKIYDGDKWGCKDYFFTMDVLKVLIMQLVVMEYSISCGIMRTEI